MTSLSSLSLSLCFVVIFLLFCFSSSSHVTIPCRPDITAMVDTKLLTHKTIIMNIHASMRCHANFECMKLCTVITYNGVGINSQ